MNSKTINIAIVGLGFGAEFIPIYQKYPGVKLVAICQRSKSKLDEIGKDEGKGIAFGTTAGREMTLAMHPLAERHPQRKPSPFRRTIVCRTGT